MEKMKPVQREASVEKSVEFEMPKFSAPAAALLMVLAGGAMDTAEAGQKGIVTQTFDAASQQVSKKAGSDAFANLLGQVLQEVKRRGLPGEADKVIEHSIPIAIDEIRNQMDTLKQGVDAEYKRRGLDAQQ